MSTGLPSSPWPIRATFDALGAAPAIKVPTLMVHSENALAPALARSFFAALQAPRDEVWVQSTGQIDFYDNPAIIAQGRRPDRRVLHRDTWGWAMRWNSLGPVTVSGASS